MLTCIKMKKNIIESLQIPEGIECIYEKNKLTCKSDSNEIFKIINIPNVKIKIEDKKVVFLSEKGNKMEFKKIKSHIAHIKNMFFGLNNKFIYKLEACNVHFPMTLKVESGFLIISNFLGERVPRKAKILPKVDVEVKGIKIIVSSHDKEAAGQTAANIERATKIKSRDRRVFQDGIFITEKPGAQNEI